MQIFNKVADVSFWNIFAKKFVIRLTVLLALSIALIIPAQQITERICGTYIEKEKFETTLSLSELVSMGLSQDKINTYSNVLTAQLKEDLESNSFISNVSTSFYNDTKHELISRSVQIPILKSDDAIKWWKDIVGADYGFPTIALNEEVIEWCEEHKNNTIIITKMYYSNYVLFPTELKAMDGDKCVDKNTTTTPTITQSTYEKECELALIGNRVGDYAYKELYDFRYVADGENNTSFIYPNFAEENKLTLNTHQFTIGNTDYHIDMVYQISFWDGALGYVILFEIIGLLAAAALAFVNTKETLSIYG